MAESQSKIDAAAEKAFAEAAQKKSADSVSAPVAKAVEAATPVKSEAQSAPKIAPVPATVATPVAKTVAPVAAGKKAQPKKKIAAKKIVVAAKKPAATAVASKKTTTISQLKDKIMATTNNNTDKTADYTAKAKEAVAGMQTRAKAAYDRAGELTSDVTAFHKGNFDAVVESAKVLASGMQDMGRSYVEDVKAAAETVTADVKKMAAVKSPTELFQLQGEIARRNLDTLVAKTSKNAEVMMKLANEAFAPISTRASVAMERFNKAA